MWWRRKSSRQKSARPPGYGRQIWLRKTSPIEAVTGQYGEWGPVVGDEPGQVYEDEIDPAWRDPDTAPGTDRQASAGGRDAFAEPETFAERERNGPSGGLGDVGRHSHRRRGDH